MRLKSKIKKEKPKREQVRDPFYQSREWKATRKQVLERDGYLCQCFECSKRTLPLSARVVDHIISIKRGGARLDPSNLQAMNMSCHQKKSAREVIR
jgi:5-methylcytosine-specific restriction protein A